MAVVAGSVAGFLALQRVFSSPNTAAAGIASNGRIIFSGGTHPGYDIYSVNPDGSDLRNLTNSPGVEETYPNVSSDGTLIAYCRSEERGAKISGGVWIMNDDGACAFRTVPHRTFFSTIRSYAPVGSASGTS